MLTISLVKAQTIKIGKLEVMKKDLAVMNWHDANKACEALGKGWRLPTKEELELLYKNKNKIGGFVSDYYWSSSEANKNAAWKQDFDYGNQHGYDKNQKRNVRAVRTL